MTPWQKPSTLLAFASWASVFILTWLLVLGKLPYDGHGLGAMLFFLGMAVIASAIASPSKKGDDNDQRL
jgi:hypothetical protein